MRRYAFLACAALLSTACNGSVTDGGPVAGGPTGPGGGGASNTGGGSSVEVSNAPLDPSPAVLARLTAPQYQNVVRDLFGVDFPKPALEIDTRPYNFSVIGASSSSVSERGVDLYGNSAHAIAAKVFVDQALRATLVPCQVAGDVDAACLTQFVKDFGLRAFRRPLQDAEVQRYTALGVGVGATDPWLGPRYIAAAMLQSPNFLYRVEVGEPAAERAGWFRYTAYEMASRLSFLLRNSAPDLALLQAAASGALSTPEGVLAEAQRLLADSAPTRAMIDQLFREYLDVPLLDDVKFPVEMDPTGTIAVSMGQEVTSLVSRIALEEQGDMRTLFTTRGTVVDASLATLYGFPAPAAGTFSPVELSADGQRAGLLTTGAMLTIHNRPNRTSPTIRGMFIRQRLLCGTVPPPPDNIPPLNEMDMGAPTTVREKIQQHALDPACSGCHRIMDPLGLGMEEFDQYGRYRAMYDNGLPIDNSGDLDGIPFNGARALGDLLSKDERVSACLVKQMYRYASSRLDGAGEEGMLSRLNAAYADSGHKFQPLLLALVQSEGFRYFKSEAP